jgi:hypothetical protein
MIDPTTNATQWSKSNAHSSFRGKGNQEQCVEKNDGT